jgi:hypothetical protein
LTGRSGFAAGAAAGVIKHAPSRPNGGERVGEATCAVTPWPHQVRAFQRLYDQWPPRLLIADEVGLGKTIQAGMLLRQAWLSGRARRILVMAPKARLFRAAEQAYGAVSDEDAARALPELSRLKLKVLRALRDGASIPLKRLKTSERAAAVRLMKAQTPLKHLISRHTRELLRRYHKAGKLKTPIADRDVSDRFVQLTDAERRVYEQVEDSISSTYDNAAGDQRTAVGFVMTIYRRRLASSFAALASTLEGRLAGCGGRRGGQEGLQLSRARHVGPGPRHHRPRLLRPACRQPGVVVAGQPDIPDTG